MKLSETETRDLQCELINLKCKLRRTERDAMRTTGETHDNSAKDPDLLNMIQTKSTTTRFAKKKTQQYSKRCGRVEIRMELE